LKEKQKVPNPRRPRRVLAGSAAAIAILLLVQACGSGSQANSRPISNSRPTSSAVGPPAWKPAPSGPLYGYPDQRLYATAAQLKRGPWAAEGAALTTIAETPSAYWAAGQPGEIKEVRQLTLAGLKARATPVIVAYNLPDRDVCGKYSASPGTGVRGYETYINQLTAAVGTGRDIVIVEPDAVPDIVRGCLGDKQAAQRYQLLHYAMSHLGALPHTSVYLDAGNPGMFADPVQLAGPLVRAGIRDGQGFSANVANFQWTNTVVNWSQRLESALGGGFGAVIDTSRNGNGPYTGPDSPQWCNPPGRSPGLAPRTAPGPAGVDAYLWIKDPGASDGACNGGPVAGRYWPAYAEELAHEAMRQQA
jgi:endoglucanase